MSTQDGKFSPKTLEYLAKVDAKLSAMTPQAVADRVSAIVATHEEWRRRKCLNMNAAENVISRGARRLLDSDLATRVTEGFPGDKEFPPLQQNVYIDEIEAIIIALAKKLFGVKFVEWRAVSTTMVNANAFFALTQPGDAILVQAMRGGANMNYHTVAIPRLRGLVVVEMPPVGSHYEIDVDAVRKLTRQVRPRMLIVGGSYVLFPYPVQELREIADTVGAFLFYDAAHVALLVAAGMFQDPIAEGAHLMAMSVHKIMSGPVGGLVVTNEEGIAQKMLQLTYPAFLQTRDQNKYAATAYSLAEMLAFGRDYARQAVLNAKALAQALETEGFKVLAKERGYTETHQVFLDLTDVGADKFERLCQESNILVTKARIVGDWERGERNGARLSVQEITRQGMKEKEMEQVARFMRRVVRDGESTRDIASEVEEFLTAYHNIQYSFDR